ISKFSRDTLYEAVLEILQGTQVKPRKFAETVELLISLKNYDPQKDKHFWHSQAWHLSDSTQLRPLLYLAIVSPLLRTCL
uniref:Uncharacterized protein n=1 Tax=Chrysemys picta bellii TaxID=8478 RepID=A0A8C3HXY9_CHRPI